MAERGKRIRRRSSKMIKKKKNETVRAREELRGGR